MVKVSTGSTSRVGHVERRHPLCPDCGYDLVATIHEGRRVCPECGYAFEPGEPLREVWPGDWTLGRGLRRGALALMLRTLAGAVAWGICAWPACAVSSVNTALGRLAGLFAISAGGLLGFMLARRMDELVGFASPWLAVPLVGAAWTALAAGATIAVRLHGAPAAPGGFIIILLAGLLATGIIVKITVLDEL